MEQISGRVVANWKKGKDKNWVFIASRKFGRMIVRTVLRDADAEWITRDDFIQLSGKPRRRKRTMNDGTVVRDVLLTKPMVEHIIHNRKVVTEYDT